MKYALRAVPGIALEKLIGHEENINLSAKVHWPIAPPKSANFALTEECNSRCKYCHCWKLKDRPRPTLDEIKMVLDSLKKLGVKQLTYAGGEPLLHPDLKQMIQYAHDLDFFIIMMTNSVLATENRMEEFIHSGLNNVTLSMDAVDEETFKLLRGIPFNLVEKRVEGWLRLREKYPNFEISVNSVISKVSMQTIPDVVRWCHKRGITVTFQILHPTFYSEDGQFDEDLKFEENDYDDLTAFINKIIAMKREGYGILASEKYLRNVPDYAIFKKVPADFRCRAGYDSISIDNRLTAYSCWTIGRIGNLKENKLEDLWYSFGYQKRRDKMWKVQCEKCWLTCHAEDWS